MSSKSQYREKTFLGKSLFPLSRRKNPEENESPSLPLNDTPIPMRTTTGNTASNESLRLKLLLTDLYSLTYNAGLTIPDPLSATIAQALGFASAHENKQWFDSLSLPNQQNINFPSINSHQEFISTGRPLNENGPFPPQLPPKPWEKNTIAEQKIFQNSVPESGSASFEENNDYLDFCFADENETVTYSLRYQEEVLDEWEGDDDPGYIVVCVPEEEANLNPDALLYKQNTRVQEYAASEKSIFSHKYNKLDQDNLRSFDEDLALAEAALIAEKAPQTPRKTRSIKNLSPKSLADNIATLLSSNTSYSPRSEVEDSVRDDQYSVGGNRHVRHSSISSIASSTALSPLKGALTPKHFAPLIPRLHDRVGKKRDGMRIDGENVIIMGAAELERIDYEKDDFLLSGDEDDNIGIKDDTLSTSSDESLLGNRVFSEKRSSIIPNLDSSSSSSSSVADEKIVPSKVIKSDLGLDDKDEKTQVDARWEEESPKFKETNDFNDHVVEEAEEEKNFEPEKNVRIVTYEQLDSFPLRVVFEKGRTGFEDSREMYYPLDAIIAGRYQVCREVCSTTFSTVLHTTDLMQDGQPVCLKIVKNCKDYFDQSLDEIKILRYMHSQGNSDRHHVLSLLDYFYYQEHLIIVSELLGENLYEFGQRLQNGGLPPYFTPQRLKTVIRQCLEAVSFMNRIGLMHCDIKPENIVMQDYQQAHVKLIDFGSACFSNGHIDTYIQSRAYRAPEVVIGLPFLSPGIDTWSLGAVLAELLTGKVLFRNESCATLLARISSIVGPLSDDMIASGSQSSRFYTSDNILFDSGLKGPGIQLLYPKKSSLKARLREPEQLLLDFASSLLTTDPRDRLYACEALAHPWFSDSANLST